MVSVHLFSVFSLTIVVDEEYHSLKYSIMSRSGEQHKNDGACLSPYLETSEPYHLFEIEFLLHHLPFCPLCSRTFLIEQLTFTSNKGIILGVPLLLHYPLVFR